MRYDITNKMIKCAENCSNSALKDGLTSQNWTQHLRPFVQKEFVLRSREVSWWKTQDIIPSSLRLDALDKIHADHQGICKCRDRAREPVWWPGISKQIKEMVMPNLLQTPKKPRRTHDSNSSGRKTMAKSRYRPVLPPWQNVHHCCKLLFEILRNRSP